MEELSRALRRQWWLIPIYIITRPMKWFDDLNLKNKATVVILAIALIVFMVFANDIDNFWVSRDNMKDQNLFQEIN